MQRHSDGTVVIAARRFEVPSRYRHLTAIEVRYASWDLTQVHLVDAESGQVLCRLYPQDKTQNATGLRRSLEPLGGEPPIQAHRARHRAAARAVDATAGRDRFAAGVSTHG